MTDGHGWDWGREPGGVRRLRARWAVTGELTLRGATHLGGGDGAAADLVLLRDATDGRPLLTGASLAGALRGHLADRLGGYRGPEPPEVARLFGAARADDSGGQSPLIVFDSLGAGDGTRAEIRDGVRIDPAAGVAADGAKYDLEVLPAGTTFPVRVELLVGPDDDEAELVALLTAALGGFCDGGIRLGARRSRGLGLVGAGKWRARRHDLGTAEGWLGWLTTDPDVPIPVGDPAFDTPAEALAAAWGGRMPGRIGDQRRRLLVTARLAIDAGLLVRSPTGGADGPDVAHLTSGGVPVLPGTGLGGALRAHALRIARQFHTDQATDQLVEAMFGPPAPRQAAGGEGQGSAPATATSGRPWASRVLVDEAGIEGGAPERVTRIRLDRATQGVVRGALFDEQPHRGGTLEVRLELREPREAEIGLLLLVLKDLLTGDLPVGGAASVGRGVLRGDATVRHPDHPGEHAVLRPGRPAPVSWVDEAIRAFVDGRFGGAPPGVPAAAGANGQPMNGGHVNGGRAGSRGGSR